MCILVFARNDELSTDKVIVYVAGTAQFDCSVSKLVCVCFAELCW